MNIQDIIKQSKNAEPFSKAQLCDMLALSPQSPESYLLMAEAKRISREVTGDKLEVHGQFALNLAPCPKNCMYCSFAVKNKIFTKVTELTIQEAIDSAQVLEAAGCNAVYMMVTANYKFGKLLEMTQEVRASLKPDTILIGNVPDQDTKTARQLKDAGLNGVYHALRLREGIDTGLDPEARKASMRAFQEAGLVVGTCVEPVGPEHNNEEIADLILYTGSLDPAYSGAARRIPIPGTEMFARGTISELRMAQIVAITRLGLPRTVLGNCTHEPYSLGAAAGASLLWAEIGANPRDIKEKTEEGRGFTPKRCTEIFIDADCGVLEGPSAYYSKSPLPEAK
ncbi:radical SAM protein [Desulfovibrio ferrophilus]|uniref:Radical SAM domain-containing protein n=1 Tax=Desulfovibrio ferrophilus TaxID=241368 RepID=A0A2Z6B3J8_9BACT|nr:radical SAM protein [Desulfovibrio ferrophilus]BBD10061.1 radical SAM domain-containing protein [Desulfovibrio ferrophilus]